MATLSETILRIPRLYRALVLLGLLGGLFTIFYFTIFSQLLETRSEKRKILEEKRIELRNNQVIADSLPMLQAEVVVLETKIKYALEQLPNEKEIPKLLNQIENLAKMVGLEVFHVRLKGEVLRGFYSDVPMDVKVRGDFHQTVFFFDEMGHLPRIINISNLDMGNVREMEERIIVTTSCLATTFRFLGERIEGGSAKAP